MPTITDFNPYRYRRSDPLWQLLWRIILPYNRVRWVPTMAGHFLFGVGLALIAAAYYTGSNIIFMAVSLIASSVMLSFLLCRWNLRKLDWQLQLPQHLRAGEKASVALQLTNRKKFFPVYSISCKLRANEANVSEIIFPETSIPPEDQASVDWIFTPLHRGQERVSLVSVASQFPFGFLRKIIRGRQDKDALVWPKRVDYEFDTNAGMRPHRSGLTNERKGASSEFINIRQYQQGDPQRLVHWKASARQRKLMIRQMAEESRDGYTLCLESAAEIWTKPEQFEQLCAFVGSLAEDLFRQGRLTATVINQGELNRIQHVGDFHRFMDALAQLQPTAHQNLIEDIRNPRILTFKPGTRNQVHVCNEGKIIGTA